MAEMLTYRCCFDIIKHKERQVNDMKSIIRDNGNSCHSHLCFWYSDCAMIKFKVFSLSGTLFYKELLWTNWILSKRINRIVATQQTVEKITVTVREFITTTLAEKIATALWNKPEWADSIVRFNYDNKIKNDCFNVIALNETGDVVGSIAFRETLIK